MEQVVAGRFRLGRRLGSGGFGEVWSAYDERLRVEVALKRVRVDPQASDTERDAVLERAEEEARHAARLRDHPNIVTVFDVVADGGTPWLVMRLVQGRTLGQEIREHGPLGPVMARHVAAGVLSALEAAHASDVLHRDVKPANIMVAEDGTVLLVDFGIARGFTLTTQTVLVGTLPYMAPERLNGKDSPAGDLFALGVSLYEATEGISPFARDTPTATMAAVALEEPPPPVRAGPLRGLITALLEKDPAKRPSATAASVLLAEGGRPREPGRAEGEADRGPDRTGAAGPPVVLTRSRMGVVAEYTVTLTKACFWAFGILGALVGLCSDPHTFDFDLPDWAMEVLPHGTRLSNGFSMLFLLGAFGAVFFLPILFFSGLFNADPDVVTIGPDGMTVTRVNWKGQTRQVSDLPWDRIERITVDLVQGHVIARFRGGDQGAEEWRQWDHQYRLEAVDGGHLVYSHRGDGSIAPALLRAPLRRFAGSLYREESDTSS
ncbi:serine/threonine-protein kinase [Streptomyces adustus]|uniref:serine/threonine-protein kinase n=1 Tax=Streptomyces adustus TaxID=1609272 RepID=UPI0037204FE9